MSTRRVIILGSTGSIGVQTLDVIDHLGRLHEAGRFPFRYEVVGLAAGSNVSALREQAARLGVRQVALASLGGGASPAGWRVGDGAAEALVREVPCDLVVAAIVGVAGLPATLAAVELGRDVALANKETLVAAGEVMIPAALRSGSHLLPVDSEHSGVWQALAGVRLGDPAWCPPLSAPADVSRVILTASGGPFRDWPAERIAEATPAEALRHPVWNMGPKVTVDCASLMNKGLELIEAHWLFGLGADRLGAIIHPQSRVHAIVELADGSSLTQVGPPDMRSPILAALAWPHRAPAPAHRCEASHTVTHTFEPADEQRFPALALARRAIVAGGTAGAILNAANEVAVQAFLSERIPFGMITRAVAHVMNLTAPAPVCGLVDVLAADASARAAAHAFLHRPEPAGR